MKAFFTVHPFNGVIDFDRKIVAMTALGFCSKVTILIENEIANPKRERPGTQSPHNPTMRILQSSDELPGVELRTHLASPKRRSE